MPPEWARPILRSVGKRLSTRRHDTYKAFRAFDADGNGFISYDEFEEELVHTLPTLPRPHTNPPPPTLPPTLHPTPP